MLYVAAVLLLVVGAAHSYLGERYILMRLFRRDNLPKLFGGTEFTRRTLRFAWHLTTVAWAALAAILVLLARPQVSAESIAQSIALVIGVAFLIHFALAFFGSRGRHLSWIVFLAVGAIAVYAGLG